MESFVGDGDFARSDVLIGSAKMGPARTTIDSEEEAEVLGAWGGAGGQTEVIGLRQERVQLVCGEFRCQQEGHCAASRIGA